MLKSLSDGQYNINERESLKHSVAEQPGESWMEEVKVCILIWLP